MVCIPMPQSVDLALGLFREVIWAEPLLFQKGKSDCSCGVAEAGHRSLRERLSRALGRAISSLQPGVPGRGQEMVISLCLTKVLPFP